MPDLVTLLAEEAAKDEALRRGLSEVLAFEELSEHRAWLILSGRLERIVDSLANSLGKRILLGAEIDQRELDRVRGFIEGVKSILALPAQIDKNFDRAIDRAWEKAKAAQDAANPDQEA